MRSGSGSDWNPVSDSGFWVHTRARRSRRDENRWAIRATVPACLVVIDPNSRISPWTSSTRSSPPKMPVWPIR